MTGTEDAIANTLTLNVQEIYGDRPVIAISNTRLRKIAMFFGVSINSSPDGRQYQVTQDVRYKEDMTAQALSALRELHQEVAAFKVFHPNNIRDGEILQNIVSKHQQNSRMQTERTAETSTLKRDNSSMSSDQTSGPSAKTTAPSFYNKAAVTISRDGETSLAGLNEYLSRGKRESFLTEFELRMRVRVEANDRGSFDVMMPTHHEGPVHTNLTDKIRAALGCMQDELEQKGTLSRSFVQNQIRLAASGKLTPKFTREAGAETLVAPTVTPTIVSPTGRFICPVRFNLPLFDESGYLAMTSTSGRPKEWRLTANQRAYKDAQFDSEKKLVVAYGVAGSAKTDIMIWCALRQLQLGLINKIYYERPMVAIDDISLGALPGGLDGKTGPYAGVFVNKMIEWLANGDYKKGEKVFKDLQSRGFLEQYNGLMKNGDTIYDSVLLVDEAQNKSMNELYHLSTRAGDGAKIVISGDFEFQNSLKGKRQSGFRDFVEMIAAVPLAQTIEMQQIDCKRSELTEQMYQARKAFEDAKAAREHSPSDKRVVHFPQARGPN